MDTKNHFNASRYECSSAVIPGRDYEKYIRFFCGLVLILLALSPVAALKGLKAEQFYQREVYQQYEKEIERMSDSIKREEIGIGQ